MKYKLGYLVAIVAGLVVSPAFAQISTDGVNPAVTVMSSAEMISLGDTVRISGAVDVFKPDVPVTLRVIGPQGNIITVDQLDVNSDNTFSTTLNTTGSMWDYNGRYIVKVQYGSIGAANKTFFDLEGGSSQNPVGVPDPDGGAAAIECGDGEVAAGDSCIEYTITGGSVVGATTSYAGQVGNSLRVEINATDDGTLTLSPNAPSCNDADYTILVDGQDWDDVRTVGNTVSVDFVAGNSTVEVIGACVVPEFGGIAAVMLIVALVAVIVASAKGRVGIMPKY